MISGRPFLAKARIPGLNSPGAPILDGLHDLTPTVPECWNHLGDSLFHQRRMHAALACYAEAMRRGGDPAARGDRRWMAWMMLGRFERAWQVSDDLEWLHQSRHGGAPCHMWDGSPTQGRDLLVRCCHGLGDTLQFLRYIPLLRRRCRSLTLQAQRELWPLLRLLEGVGQLVPSWEVLPEGLQYDLEIEIMELPYLFRSTVATLPRQVPYLRVDEALVHAKRRVVEAIECGMRNAECGMQETGDRRQETECGNAREMPGSITSTITTYDYEHENRQRSKDALKVGLVWASSRWNAMRSVPLELFDNLARLPGVRVFSLQWGEEREELRARAEMPVIDLTDEVETIEETAAAILAMDLIICPDTMLAHLAGALGRPVWVMLLHRADWRWMVAGERSPWYPTMRLFRQSRPGDWASVVARVTGEVRRLIEPARVG